MWRATAGGCRRRRSCRRGRRRGRRPARSSTVSGGRGLDRPAQRVDALDRGASRRAGSTSTSSPGRSTPPATLAGVAAVVACRGSPTGPGSARRRGCGPRATSSCSSWASSGSPSNHGVCSERVDDVVARERRHRDRARVLRPRAARPARRSRDSISRKRALVPVDEVHLVHARDQVADAEQRGDRGVPARLLDDPVARVDEHERRVGGRGAGDHVARVADVAGGVGDDERAPRRGEEAVGDVDRDPLLALGAQPVGELREVDLGVARPGRPSATWSRRAAARSGSSCRRRPSRRSPGA